MADLRERGKARRRGEVIAAAASLWRERRLDAVTVPDIAAAAEVSAPTVYNLVGGVDALKIAIIEDLLARLELRVAAAPQRGVDRCVFRALASAQMFLADATLHRRILVGIPQAVFDGAQLSRDGSAFQRSAIRDAQMLGELDPGIDADALAWQVHVNYLGCLFAWACGSLDDAGFVRAAELAVLAPVAACCLSTTRARLDVRTRALLRADAPALIQSMAEATA